MSITPVAELSTLFNKQQLPKEELDTIITLALSIGLDGGPGDVGASPTPIVSKAFNPDRDCNDELASIRK